MPRRVAAFCRPLRPVFLLVSFSRWQIPVVGIGVVLIAAGVPPPRPGELTAPLLHAKTTPPTNAVEERHYANGKRWENARQTTANLGNLGKKQGKWGQNVDTRGKTRGMAFQITNIRKERTAVGAGKFA